MTVRLTAAFLGLDTALKPSYPISMVGWVGGGSFPTPDSTVFSQGGPGGVVVGKITSANGYAQGIDFTAGVGGASVSKNSAPIYSTSALQLFVVVFESASSRTVYFGNNTGVTATTTQSSPNIGTHNVFQIGADGGNNRFNNADFAEVSVFGVALTAADVASLLAGTLAESLPGCIASFPLRSATDLTSTNGTYTLTPTGTVSAGVLAHPVTRAAPADTTVPTQTGAITVGTVGSSSIQFTWPAGADNVAVTSYETSLDGTNWTDRGNVLTYTQTGLSASTSYTFRVRAKDAAGNVSTPALSITQSTSVAPATAITLSGPSGGLNGAASSPFTVGANGGLSSTVTVTPSDGGGGGTFNPISVQISAGTPTATFTYTPGSTGAKTISVANNGGLTAPSTVAYTVSATTATAVSLTLTSDGTTPAASLTGLKWAFFDQANPQSFAAPTAKGSAGSTNSSGLLTLSITGTALTQGATGYLIVTDGTGSASTAANVFSGPVVVS